MTLTHNVLSLQITEVELNPAGSDVGAEWVELFLEEETNLTLFYLENNDGERYALNATYPAGYSIITFSTGWLDNSDEGVKILIANGTDEAILFETELFADSENNDETWSYCDGEWSFGAPTKEAENNCVTEEPEEEVVEEEPVEDEVEEEPEEPIEETPEETSQPIDDIIEELKKEPVEEPVKKQVTQPQKTTAKKELTTQELTDDRPLTMPEEKQVVEEYSTKDNHKRYWVLASFGLTLLLLITLIILRKI